MLMKKQLLQASQKLEKKQNNVKNVKAVPNGMLPSRQTSEIIKTCHLGGSIFLGRKAKFSFEIKMDIVQRYLTGKPSANHEAVLDDLNGEGSYAAICRKYGITG